MAISLYDVSVASFLQTVGGVAGFLERGLAHCQDNGIDPQETLPGLKSGRELLR